MSYDPTVPQGPQFFSASQPIIQGNFNKLNADFSIDHLPFTTGVGAGQGEHKKITFNDVQAVPPVGFIAPKGELFTQASTGPNVFSDLYWGAKGTTTPALNPVPISRLTGGGVTAAAWVKFDVAGAILAQYNVSAVGVAGTNFTINFTRIFTNSNYVVLALSTNANVFVVSQATNNCVVNMNNSIPFSGHVVCFGDLQ